MPSLPATWNMDSFSPNLRTTTQQMRRIITDHYQMSSEPRLVKRAITAARWRDYSTSVHSIDNISSSSYALFGAKKVSRRQPSMFTRMATLEARGAKRMLVFFLPFMFYAFGFVLGIVYLQQATPFLVISGVCVFSVAPGLFMFPAMYPYYQRALEIYTYERADGVGRAADLVLQGFIRFSSLSLLPSVLASTLAYFMLVNSQSVTVLVYLQFVLTNIALTQTWITLLIALICAIPDSAFQVSSGISSVFGFTSGFFIPVQQLGWWWRWLVYINPNYYAVSSVAVFVLSDFTTSCVGTEFGCFLQSGTQVLRQFNFDQVNPYLHLVIILSFTIFYLLLAIFCNWVRHTSLQSKLKRLRAIIFRSSDTLSQEFKKNPEEFAKSFSMDSTEEPPNGGEEGEGQGEEEEGLVPTTPLSPICEDDEDHTGDPMTPHTKAVKNWQSMAGRSLELGDKIQSESPGPSEGATNNTSGWAKVQKRVRINDDKPTRPTLIPLKSDEEVKSAYLRDGDSHKVWRPKKAPQLADLVSDLLKKERAKRGNEPSVAATPSGQRSSLTPTVPSRGNLKSRQKTVFNRALVAQELLRETTDELLKEDESSQPKPHLSLLEASKKITANIKKQRSADKEGKGEDFSSVVRKCLEKVRSEDGSVDAETPLIEPSPTSKSAVNALKHRRGSRRGSKLGPIPLKKWKNFAKQEAKGWERKNPTYDRTVSEYPLKGLEEVPESTLDHRALGRSTSADHVTGTSPKEGSSFGVTFVEPNASANGNHQSSPMNVTMTDMTTPPAHQPLMKKDSHGVMKQSKMAQLKGAVGRRGSSGLPRQNPIDVEGSLSSSSLAASGGVSGRKSDGSEGMSGGKQERLLLSDPPRGKKHERLPHSGEGVTSTLL